MREYTYGRRPVDIVYSSEFSERADALEMERRIKVWSRGKEEALIRGDWHEVRRLSMGKSNRTSTGSGRTGQAFRIDYPSVNTGQRCCGSRCQWTPLDAKYDLGTSARRNAATAGYAGLPVKWVAIRAFSTAWSTSAWHVVPQTGDCCSSPVDRQGVIRGGQPPTPHSAPKLP